MSTFARMLKNITTDDTCRKGDIVEVEYLYDGKYLLLNKIGCDKPIEYQCYKDDIHIISEKEARKNNSLNP